MPCKTMKNNDNYYIAITGSASLPYPPFVGQRGGADNTLKAGPRKSPWFGSVLNQTLRFQPAAFGSGQPVAGTLCLVQHGPKPWALFLKPK